MNKKLKLILFFVMIVGILCVSIVLIYQMNRITNDNEFFSSLMGNMNKQIFNQSTFVFLLCIYGLLFLLCLNRFIEDDISIVLALIIGALIYAIISNIVLCIGIKFNKLSVIIGSLIMLVLCYIFAKPDIKAIKVKKFILPLIAYLSLSLFFCALCVFRFSYDSYIYIGIGEKIAYMGYISDELIPFISGFSIFTSLFFSPAEFFNYDFSQGLYIFFNASFVICVGYFAYKELSGQIKNSHAILAGIGVFLSIIGANIFFEIMYWPLSNLLAAATLFMTIYFIYKSSKNDNNVFYLYFSLLFAVSFIWLRTENSLLLLIIIFLMSNMGFNNKQIIKYIGVCLTAILLWYIRFFYIASITFTDGSFLTIDKALMVVIAYVIMLIYMYFFKNIKFIKENPRKMDVLFFGIFALGIIGLGALDINHLLENIKSTVINMFRNGGWGGSLIIFSGIIVIYYSIVKKYSIWDKALLSFCMFHMLIYLLREQPLRIGYGDSGNRYFVYIIPIMSYMIAENLLPKLLKNPLDIDS